MKWMVVISLFSGVAGYFILHPESPVIGGAGPVSISGSKAFPKVVQANSQKQKASPGMVTLHSPRMKGVLLRPEWGQILSRIPEHKRNEMVSDGFNHPEEASLVELFLAVKLNDFQPPLGPEEQERMNLELSSSIREASPEFFQELQRLALNGFQSDAFLKERSALHQALGTASVESPVAREITRDLISRDRYLNRNQPDSEILKEYAITPGHPLFQEFNEMGQRSPASVSP